MMIILNYSCIYSYNFVHFFFGVDWELYSRPDQFLVARAASVCIQKLFDLCIANITVMIFTLIWEILKTCHHEKGTSLHVIQSHHMVLLKSQWITTNLLLLHPSGLLTGKVYYHPIAELTYTKICFAYNISQWNHLPIEVIWSRSWFAFKQLL